MVDLPPSTFYNMGYGQHQKLPDTSFNRYINDERSHILWEEILKNIHNHDFNRYMNQHLTGIQIVIEEQIS